VEKITYPSSLWYGSSESPNVQKRIYKEQQFNVLFDFLVMIIDLFYEIKYIQGFLKSL